MEKLRVLTSTKPTRQPIPSIWLAPKKTSPRAPQSHSDESRPSSLDLDSDSLCSKYSSYTETTEYLSTRNMASDSSFSELRHNLSPHSAREWKHELQQLGLFFKLFQGLLSSIHTLAHSQWGIKSISQ